MRNEIERAITAQNPESLQDETVQRRIANELPSVVIREGRKCPRWMNLTILLNVLNNALFEETRKVDD
jgi:hypothetical protein